MLKFKKYMSKVRLDKIVETILADLEFGFVFCCCFFFCRVCVCGLRASIGSFSNDNGGGGKENVP